jgi:hypothetical protein
VSDVALLVQHGHGKSDKIARALETGELNGVIYAPRNERPDNLLAYIDSIADSFSDATQIIDPQFYACTVAGGTMGRLQEYPFFRPDLQYRNFIAASDIVSYVRAVIDFQVSTRVTHLCSPTIAVDSFNDRWNSIAFNLAAETINYHQAIADPRPLLISLVLHEQAFRSASQLDDFLDVLTDFDCAGFYIVLVHESTTFTQVVNSNSLAGLLYAVHVLTNLNDFDVYAGYADFLSLALHAVGATGTSCGWNSGLRRFNFARFEPSTGGRRPRARYSSLPLLNSITITPDFDAISRLGEVGRVLSRTRYDRGFTRELPSHVSWDESTSSLHHWEVLHRGIRDVVAAGETRERLSHLERAMRTAQDLYGRLSRAGVPFDSSSGPNHIRDWASGIAEFRTRAGV